MPLSIIAGTGFRVLLPFLANGVSWGGVVSINPVVCRVETDQRSQGDEQPAHSIHVQEFDSQNRIVAESHTAITPSPRKSVRLYEYSFGFLVRSSWDDDGNGLSEWEQQHSYDMAGHVTESKTIRAGRIELAVKYYYLPNGRAKRREKDRNSDGAIDETKLYEYSDDGFLVAETVDRAIDGDLYAHYSYEYSDGLLTKSSMVDPYYHVTSDIEYLYRADQLIREEHGYYRGEPSYVGLYKYDGARNLIEQSREEAGHVSSVSYEYDGKDFLVGMISRSPYGVSNSRLKYDGCKTPIIRISPELAYAP